MNHATMPGLELLWMFRLRPDPAVPTQIQPLAVCTVPYKITKISYLPIASNEREKKLSDLKARPLSERKKTFFGYCQASRKSLVLSALKWRTCIVLCVMSATKEMQSTRQLTRIVPKKKTKYNTLIIIYSTIHLPRFPSQKIRRLNRSADTEVRDSEE